MAFLSSLFTACFFGPCHVMPAAPDSDADSDLVNSGLDDPTQEPALEDTKKILHKTSTSPPEGRDPESTST